MNTVKALHGWTAVPRVPAVLLMDSSASELKPLTVDEITLPDSPLAKEVLAYAKRELNEQTFNHSIRVYYYGEDNASELLAYDMETLTESFHIGRAIQLHHFPDWRLSPETYLLTALLHDIGTTDTNLSATLLSFEFYGGFLSLSYLKSQKAPVEQAEAVAEAVIRHQDIGESGKITTLGQLIQLATIFDNTGKHAQLLHPTTIQDVIERYHRKGWSQCFADTIRRETRAKPWAHTTALGEEDFPAMVMDNKVGGKWD